MVVPPAAPGLLGKKWRAEAPVLVTEILSPHPWSSAGRSMALEEHRLGPEPNTRRKPRQERGQRGFVRQNLDLVFGHGHSVTHMPITECHLCGWRTPFIAPPCQAEDSMRWILALDKGSQASTWCVVLRQFQDLQ